MAAFEADVAELGKIVGALPVDNTPKGQFFQELQKLVGLVKGNSAKEMILLARTVTTAVNGFVARAQAVSDAIPARANRDDMMSHVLQVKHFGVQMKMLLAVKAAGSAASAEDSQLRACVNGIVTEIKYVLNLDFFKPAAAAAGEDGEDEPDPFASGTVMAVTIKVEAGASVKAYRFNADQSFFEVIMAVKQKTGMTDDGKELGVYQPPSGTQPGRWLRLERPIGYYDLKNGDIVVVKKRFRPLTLRMMDGTTKSVGVDLSIATGEVVANISKKLNIANPEEYSLAKLDGKWLVSTRSLAEQDIDEKDVLMLKKRLSSDAVVDRSDPAQLHLLYLDCHDRVINSQMLTTRAEAIQLAALDCQILYGNHDPVKNKKGWLELGRIINSEWLKKVKEKDVYREHMKLVGMSELDAEYRYVQFCRSLKTYGVTIFKVEEKKKGTNKLAPLYLGITRESILRMNYETKEIEKQWPITHLRRWAPSEKSITLDFGDYEGDYYTVMTLEGENISQLIGGHMDIILKRKKDVGRTEQEDHSDVAIEEFVAPTRAAAFETQQPGIAVPGEKATISPLPAHKPSPPASSYKQAVAFYNFTGNPEQRQLSFQKGDIISVTNQYDNGWWAGEFKGSLGYFPASYVKLIIGASPSPASPTSSLMPGNVLLPNLALGKPAKQSSVCSWSRGPNDAQGGNNGTFLRYGFHTDCDENAWWQVDLGKVEAIGEVRIYNSHFPERARTAQVLLSPDERAWEKVYAHQGNAWQGALSVPLNGKSARFVRVQLAEKNYLHLEQIEVYPSGAGVAAAAASPTPVQPSQEPVGAAQLLLGPPPSARNDPVAYKNYMRKQFDLLAQQAKEHPASSHPNASPGSPAPVAAHSPVLPSSVLPVHPALPSTIETRPPSPSPKQLPSKPLPKPPPQRGSSGAGAADFAVRPVSTMLRAATEAHSIAYDQLRIDKEALAEGAFGKVYRVMHQASGTMYAAKVLKVTEAELDEEARDDFKREAALLYSLRHANVVGFAGVSRDPSGTLILLTDFMAGGGLNTWLYKKQHKFEPRIRLRLATEIASGLAYLHSRDVVHRDLKSDNILLDEDGMHAKVADLGLAKLRSASSYYMHGQVGTIMYMAPEMLRKEKFSSAADVYSFSLVVFELYTARRPYPLRLASDMDALREAVAVRGERPVDRDNAVLPGVQVVMQRCWVDEPRQRPTMSTVAEEFLSLIGKLL